MVREQEKANQSSIMMMMSSLKLVLIFGVGLVIGLGLYHLNPKNNTNLSDDYWPPQHNAVVNDTDNQLTCADLRLRPAKFDYFLFALQWPAAFCNIQRSKPRKCEPRKPKHRDNFTVHGLWPQLNNATSPVCCECEEQLTDDDLKAVGDDLLKYWPNLFDAERPSQNNSYFWKNQWKKHGTCSSTVFRPQEYLNITLELAKKYAGRISVELKERGIKPNGATPYREADITAAVKQATDNHEPIINMQLNDLDEHLLVEICLCVEKDGTTLRDCDPVYIFADPNETHAAKILSV